MLPRSKCLETIIPPRDKCRSLAERSRIILLRQPVVGFIPSLCVEARAECPHVPMPSFKRFVRIAVHHRKQVEEVLPKDVWSDVIYTLVNFIGGLLAPRDSRVYSVSGMLRADEEKNQNHCWNPRS